MNRVVAYRLVVPMFLLLLLPYAYALTQFGLIQMHYQLSVGHIAPVLTPSTISLNLPTLYNPTMKTYYVELKHTDPQNPVATLEVYEDCYIYAVLLTTNDTNLPHIDIHVKVENANYSRELWLAMDAPFENFALVPMGTYSVSVRAYGEFAEGLTEAIGTIGIELRYDFL